jgi:ribulose-5-phosphate 4-epimerase/fuculose-1-phosphate aldolase
MAQSLKEPASASANADSEREARVELAALYRWAARYDWDELLFAHMSARVPGAPDEMLLAPPQLLFEEITASRLHRLGRDGKHVVPHAETPHAFAFPFHRGIYDAFPEARCVVHLHTRAGTAVAAQADGLLPISQYAIWLGRIGYHDYEGSISSPEEGRRLAKNFGGNRVCIQRSHGFVLWGRSIPEAFLLTYVVQRACEIQIAALAGGAKPYVPPPAVIDAGPRDAVDILTGGSWFAAPNWAAARRRLDREAPGYAD